MNEEEKAYYREVYKLAIERETEEIKEEQAYFLELNKLAIEIVGPCKNEDYEDDVMSMMSYINELADRNFEIFKHKRKEIKDVILHRRKKEVEF
jgi:hypothetical protein